jgi:hypothetical protein
LLALELFMRASAFLVSGPSASAAAWLASLLVPVLVACGGETTSLGRQGDDGTSAGTGGSGGSSAGTGGSSAGTGGSSAGAAGTSQGCVLIDLTCKDDEKKVFAANGCQACLACPSVPDPYLPAGSCDSGKLEPILGDDGCQTGWKCAAPVPTCPDVYAPTPRDCPSGGWSAVMSGQCQIGWECVKCPVVGDPSFCADGTIIVAINDGTCDYGNVTCLPCDTAQPPQPNFCNDGGLVLKDANGACLGAAECSCPDQAGCPPDSVSLAVPGSACGLFVCNNVGCGTPPQPTETCAGNFVWERDLKDCVTQAVCQPSL